MERPRRPRQQRTGKAATRVVRLVDAHVGHRISERRAALALSPGALAKRLDMPVERLRRCEAGRASLTVSRLHEIGVALDVPVGYFFDGLSGHGAKGAPATAPKGGRRPTARELSQLVDAYWQVGDPTLRRELFSLIATLAAADGPEPN